MPIRHRDLTQLEIIEIMQHPPYWWVPSEMIPGAMMTVSFNHKAIYFRVGELVRAINMGDIKNEDVEELRNWFARRL